MSLRITSFLIALLVTTSAWAAPQFKYAEPKPSGLVAQEGNLQAFVGKTYWTSPDGGGIIGAVDFYSLPGINKFEVSQDSQFTIVEVIDKPDTYTTFFKVRFDDKNKTIGYLTTDEFLLKSEPPQNPFFHWSVTTFNISDKAPPAQIVNNLIADSKSEENDRIRATEAWLATVIKKRNSNPPRLGMNSSQVRSSSWGNATDINRTVVQGLTREQWVYPWGFVYLSNGTVTAVQD